MNCRGTLIGNILTKFLSIIIVFVIMLIFVIVSGFISVGSRFSEDLMGDFTNDYILLNGEVVTVNEAIGMFCNDKSIEDALKISLRDDFMEEYGDGNAFAFAFLDDGGLSAQRSYVLYSWYGTFMEDYDKDKPKILYSNFHDIFKLGAKNVQNKLFCNDPVFILYVKSGGVNES